MDHGIITENQLDVWVRGNANKAQGVIVELVYRLVAASSPRSERRFPLGDSIGQPGPDGFLDTDFSDPFVPQGKSYWEIGTGERAREKATADYRERTAATLLEVRRNSTFVFVTPLSGRKGWQYASQSRWVRTRARRKEWKEVRVVDGSRLIDWLHCFPSVERWFAYQMGFPVTQIETPEHRWADLRTIGDPPPLSPQLFLVNRDAACNKVKEIFAGNSLRLQVDTHYPGQMADFISACIATLEESTRYDVVSRCLIISGTEAWEAICELRDRHVLIADFPVDETDSFGIRLLEKAKRTGHAVILSGKPGGLPHPNRVPIPNPKNFQIKEALEKAGYTEERARILAQKSNGNLSSLLRLLQNLSLMPEWAQGTDAAELAIAELLGAWNENSEADKAIAEKLSGKTYREWIGRIREIALRPGTPLSQHGSAWKMIARFEGWYALGSRLFDEHLDRLKEVAVKILRERDPQFDLPPDERYTASLDGKVLAYSRLLRNGLTESLALVGSHSKALSSCSFGKAEGTAVLAVREIFADADWVLWASLNDLLPLLAEAAPREFLDAVENALNQDPCLFDTVFSQERSGITGRNYMTGLLWALETLAWDTEYLSRVVVILGELAARDPGGNWGNRPANSLSTILLPWFPQTTAPVAKRQTAVTTLLKEQPDIAWKMLLGLLPRSHQVSHGSRKPAWREVIPGDWSSGVSDQEYREQVVAYSELAIDEAKQNIEKLVELSDRLDDLPPSTRDQLLAYLHSDTVTTMPQTNRLRLWTKLVDLVSNHRKFADAEWAMEAEVVNEIAAVAESLAPDSPFYRHQRLFSERDFELYEEKGNYEEQQKELNQRREKAVDEILAKGRIVNILEFAKAVESPWRVGVALGVIASPDVEDTILPTLLQSETKSLVQLSGGFVWGKFRRFGWQWADNVGASKWTPSQKGQFLAYLPFVPETWKRVTRLLAENESSYWAKTNANPYEAEEGLELAVDPLVQYGRPYAAVRCLEKLRHDKRLLNSQQAIHVLRAVLLSSESTHAMDAHAIVEVIKALQQDPLTNPDDLFQIEWAFLPLLDRHHGASPQFLEQRLADDPGFFCEVIRTVFRSKKEERSVEEPTEQQKNIATNAYRLLNDWRLPPGSQRDGTFNGDTLTRWLKEVGSTCTESDHLEVALTMVGHVLIHTPPDPDGLWLHHSAAELLNAKDANDMRDGFRTALFNSRGAYWVDLEGKKERELAEKYRTQADAVETRGYHRLASSLRDLVNSYERDAERMASRSFHDD